MEEVWTESYGPCRGTPVTRYAVHAGSARVR